tara:strand:- start:548 stop:1042 length:495 start_codon:yes stop_codon:yes gene_type:complete
MKLVKTGGLIVNADTAAVSLDNVFTTDYDDYVIYCTKFGGNGSSINMRLIETGGSERSVSKYDFHQMYTDSSTPIAYQRSSNQNRVYDFFWKADNSSMKAYIFSPMLAQQTRAIVDGVNEGSNGFFLGFNFTNDTEQHRGIKFYQQGASDAFDEGAIVVYGIKQ